MINFINSMIVGTNQISTKRKYLWYTIGSSLFALATLIMTIVVTRSVGERIGGMFSIGLSLAQWFSTIAKFEIRTYQVTDVKNEFTFENYFSFRFIMCICAYSVSILYVIISAYSLLKVTVVLLLCSYKVLECIADIFEGEFQKRNRIDISGKSMFFRTLFSMSVLIISLVISHEIVISLILMNICAIISIFVLDLIPITVYNKIRFDLNFSLGKKIFMVCGPLAVSAFINSYIVNSSKLAVDRTMSDEAQLYYTAVFMPNMVINLLSGIVFKPMQTTMAIYYRDKDYYKFKRMIVKMVSIIGVFTVMCIVGAYMIGIPVLETLYKVKLKSYKDVLLILLFAGGINAINILLYYILTIMRKQNIMVVLYSIVAAISILFIDNITFKLGLKGAAIGYLMLVSLLMFMLVSCIVFFWKRIKEYNRKVDIS